ncbi:MAG: hypothetical protein IIA67_06255 [Planctomycetes bacterium]|nr:hypothetical protein [Planctomycetota bacterium]
MDRRRLFRRLLWCAVGPALLVATAAVFSDKPARQLAAAPHLVAPTRAVRDFYDADWPEVYLIVMAKCVGCHRPGTDQIDFSSHAKIMAARTEDGEPIVVPGSPQRSPLYEQVVWNVNAERDSKRPDEPLMPQDHREWLTAGQLATLHRWIENGAQAAHSDTSCGAAPLSEIDFPSAKLCKACHPNQYEQWSRSMHAYSQHSLVFQAFNLTLQERTSGTIGTFCTRCHTPVGTALGENGSRRNVHRSRIAMEGVTCVVCHRQSKNHGKASGRVALLPGKLLETCMFGPFESGGSDRFKAHDSVHHPHIRTSAFCGTCHDVTSPGGVRLEEAFSEWRNSPAAKQNITCQQCHMGPVQGVAISEDQRPLGRAATIPGEDKRKIPLRPITDHTFSGPDYSMLPDTEFPYKLDWMYEVDYRDRRRLTPYQQRTLSELRRANRRQLRIADRKRYEVLRNAAEICVDAPRTACPGEKLKVRVAVTSKIAGHSFPTGFTAERQAWVEITLRDPAGRIVFASGDLDRNGDLRDGHSHEVEAGRLARDKYLLNFQNPFVALTARGTERLVKLSINRHHQPLNIVRPATGISASRGRPEVFRLAKGALGPLKTEGQTYPIELPTIEGDYLLDVKLNFRHMPPGLMDRIGAPHLKRQLEIVVIDSHRSMIHVSRR